MKNEKGISKKLLNIIVHDFDGCEWFIIASNDLMKIIKDTMDMCQDSSKSFEAMKDLIGNIGIGINNVEKCLEEVEECYNKLVEVLCSEVKKK